MTISQNPEEEKIPSAENIAHEDESSEQRDERESREQESRFKEGQILRFVRVRFPGNSRSFPFLIGKRRIEYGQKVVAMSDRGMAVGYVNSFPYDVPFNKSMLPVRSIAKVADSEDYVKDQEGYRQQKNAENMCNQLIEQHKLDMYLTHVEFTSFGKKAVFYFIAPSRVDFRDLVRDLVHKLKTRIELRQISVRDRSASVGGIGPCGLELCCSSFLTKYGNVGIKMAKNQDLTLNFSKLNGVCGQLKCCLQYEDDVYKDKRARLPKEGDFVTTHTNEMGRVDRIHLLSEQFDMMTNRGVRKRYVSDLYKETTTKEGANFPNEFDMVTDETHKVVGLEESEKKKARAIETEINSYKEKSKSFAETIFADLFGEKTLDYSLPEVEEVGVKPSNVKLPDDEEEIQYTPDAEDTLDDDEDDMFEDVKITHTRVKEDNRPARDTSHMGRDNNRNQNQNQNQNRNRPPQQGQGRNNNNNRPQQNNNRNQNQNRGPRPDNRQGGNQGGGNNNNNRRPPPRG